MKKRISMRAAAAASEAPVTYRITCAEYPFYIGQIDLGQKIDLYFREDAMDLPYIEIGDWMPLMNLSVGDSKAGVKFTLDTAGSVVTLTRQNTDQEAYDNGIPMVIDFEKGTIEFQDYNLFCLRAGSSTIMDTVTMKVFNDAGEPALLAPLPARSQAHRGRGQRRPVPGRQDHIVRDFKSSRKSIHGNQVEPLQGHHLPRSV